MARPLRLEYDGAFYHVTSRGNERHRIFFSDADCRKFIDYLGQAKEKYGIVLHGYVLMPNHYHLLIETPSANLSKAMQYLNGAYTAYINAKKGRSGHLFQGRYKALIVDQDSYLGELSRYIHLNPVRAKMSEKPEDHSYSSYGTYISGKPSPLVTTELVLGMAGGVNRYRAFVEAGMAGQLENPTEKLYGGMILGNAGFIKETLRKLKEGYEGKPEISHRRALRTAERGDEILDIVEKEFQVSAEDITTGRHPAAKKTVIYLLKKYTGMTNGEIGKLFDSLGYSAVAKAFGRFDNEMRKDRKLRKLIMRLEKNMSNVKG